MIALRVVDPWRTGGALGSRNFFLGSAQAQAPRMPRRHLGDTAGDVAGFVNDAIEEIDYQLTAAGAEADMVSPSALRVEPDKYTQVGGIGYSFPPQEIRAVIMADATALGGLAERIRTGVLAHYITADQAQQLSNLYAKAQKLFQYLQGMDLVPVQSGHETQAQAHVDQHLTEARRLMENAEKTVVAAEAGTVPVLEPSEKALGPLQIAAGIGITAGIGVLLWNLLG